MADPEAGGGAVPGPTRRPPQQNGALLRNLLRRISEGNSPQVEPDVHRTGSSEEKKQQHAYSSHVDVLGKEAAAQMAELKYDDIGKRQVKVEEMFVLEKGIIHPYNRFFRMWWWLTIAAAAVTGWLIPYMIAFLSGSDGKGSAAYAIEATLLAIFLGDMLSSFFVARYEQGVLIGDRKTLIKIYMRFRFWWDILTVFPWDWIALSAMGLLGSTSVQARFISLLGLLKLGRMYRIDRLYRHLEFNLALPLGVTRLTRIATYGFFLVHWAACCFWFIAVQEQGLGFNSWLTELEETDPGAISWSVWDQYTFSVWWAVSVFYQLGAGYNFGPVTLAEVIFCMVYIAVNILLWAWIIGSITLLVARADEASNKYRHRMHALERYGHDKGLPQDMKDLIMEHLRLHYTTNQEADEQMLATLPTTLRRRVLRHMYGQQLQRCWLLAGVKPKFFDALLGVARLETFMPQVELFTEGDEVNELMFVVAGYLEVFASSAAAEEKDMESILDAARYSRSPSAVLSDMSKGKKFGVGSGYSMLGPADVIGEVAFFTEVPQFELVRSLTVCRVLVVPRPAYSALAADFPLSSTAILEALQKNAEQVVSTEFRGGAASRLLRGSLVATLPGLSYQHTSPETLGQRVQGDSKEAFTRETWRGTNISGAASMGGLSVRQQQVVGNLQRIRAVVKHHVAQADETRTGQFLAAAAKGEADRVKLLLQQGYNPNTCDYDKRTALMLAAANGHKAVIDMLLAVQANLNVKDNMSRTALLEAARGGHEDILNTLLARGAKLSLDSTSQCQALCGAVSGGDINQLKYLLLAGADANAADHDNRTALHVAAAESNLSAARVLVDVGHAKLDVVSRHGLTPLDEAWAAAATAVLEYMETLVSPEAAAAARARDKSRRAEAMLRAAAAGDVAAVQRLLDRGTLPDACGLDKRTGLMMAAAHGQQAVVSLLLSAGANPNSRDTVGSSPLLEAVKAGHEAVLQQLVQAGATLQMSNSELACELCNLVYEEREALLRRYIAAGANVAAGDYDKRTPLHIAAAEGKLNMVQLLVQEGGVDLSAKDRWGSTPLDEAKRVAASDVAAYLSSPAAQAAASVARSRAASRQQQQLMQANLGAGQS